MGTSRLKEMVQVTCVVWEAKPWLHWVAAYSIVMSYFFFFRLHTMGAILEIFASADQNTAGNKFAGLLLGILEDFVISTLLVLLLLVSDVAGSIIRRACVRKDKRKSLTLRLVTLFLRFLVAFVLVAAVMTPFAADLLLIRTRELRFTMDYITMAIREKDHASGLQVDKREVRLAKETVVATVIIALFFAFVYASCLDLTRWVLRRNKPRQR